MAKLNRQSSKKNHKEMDLPHTMTVPPIRSLLDNVPPSQEVLGVYIDDLDSQLEENSRKYVALEKCPFSVINW